MQSFSAWMADNKPLAYGLIALAVVVAALLLFWLVRLAMGSRSRFGLGRSRQPRLGIVDAFDLDRTRQLVLIRRDNVEHLVMIGGPNDVLVETGITRPAVAGLLPSAESRREAAPVAQQPLVPVFERSPPPPPPPSTGTASRNPLPPPPPGRPPGPPRSLQPGPPRPPAAESRAEPTVARQEPPSGGLEPPPRPPVAPPRPPFPRTTPVAPRQDPVRQEGARANDTPFEASRPGLPRADVTPPGRLPPAWPAAPKVDRAETAPPSPRGPLSADPQPQQAPRPANRTLGSLEDEMARLLGRPPDRVP